MRTNLLLFVVIVFCIHFSAGVALGMNSPGSDNIFWYEIYLNQSNQGLLQIKSGQGSFESMYKNISKNDKIPFYAETKAGELKDPLSLSSVVFDGDKEFKIYYDLEKRADERISSLIKGNKREKAAIINEKDLPKLVLDKMPVVNLESIIFGFVNNTVREGKKMLLFDAQSKLHLRIYFQKQKTYTSSINGRNCEMIKYVCKKTNVPDKPDKTIFEMEVTQGGVPVNISSPSDRWEFRIRSIGEGEYKSYDKVESFYRPLVKRELGDAQTGTASDLRVFDAAMQTNRSGVPVFSCNFELSIPISAQYKGESLAKEYVRDKYFSSLGKSSLSTRKVLDKKTNDRTGETHYYVNISKKELCDRWMPYSDYCNSTSQTREGNSLVYTYSGTEEVPRDKFIKGLSTSSGEFGSLIEENNKSKSDAELKNLQKKAQKYLKNNKLRSTEVSRLETNATKESSYMGLGGTYIIIDYSYRRQIPINSVKDSAVQVMYNKFCKGRCSTNYSWPELKKDLVITDQGGFTLSFPKSEIDQMIRARQKQRCRNISRKLEQVEIKDCSIQNKSCRIRGGKKVVETPELRSRIRDSLLKEHTYLKHNFQDWIKQDKRYWKFYQLSSDVNLCTGLE